MDKISKVGNAWTPRNVFFLVVALLLVVVVGYNIYHGITVKKVNVPGVMDLEFHSPNDARSNNTVSSSTSPQPTSTDATAALESQLADLERQELESRQAQLQSRLHELEQRIANNTSAPAAPAPRAVIRYDLTGSWESDEGVTYILSQQGNTVTLQEMNPLFGVTAVGEGRLNNNQLSITYMTALGTQGQGVLRVIDDGDELSGTITDLTTGFTQPLVIYR